MRKSNMDFTSFIMRRLLGVVDWPMFAPTVVVDFLARNLVTVNPE
jgi:hypothetical protein